MPTKSLAIALLVVLTPAAYSAGKADPGAKVYVEPVAPYVSGVEPGVGIVNPECRWNAYLVEHLVKDSAGRIVVAPSLPDVAGRKLVLQVDADANPAPASEISPRWLEASAKLLDESGRVLGETAFRHYVESGSLRECKNLKSMAADLSSDIAGWSENPTIAIKVGATMSVRSNDAIDETNGTACPLTAQLPRFIADKSDGDVYVFAGDIKAAKGKRLLLSITSAHGLGPGQQRGDKWLTVNGSLVDDDRELGSFVVRHISQRSRGGCGMLDQLSEELRDDILDWLAHPTANAQLGDAEETKSARR
jgi:hypothetical protein